MGVVVGVGLGVGARRCLWEAVRPRSAAREVGHKHVTYHSSSTACAVHDSAGRAFYQGPSHTSSQRCPPFTSSCKALA